MRSLVNQKQIASLGTIHIIGVGGIGMSGIATVMSSWGYRVQGSDIASTQCTRRLQSLGIKVFDSHAAANLDEACYVVISSAIKNDNIELIAARAKGIPVISRSQMLAEIMRFKTCVAVSGSHGKTTTTSLIAHMFETAGVMPTVINGGIINHKGTNAYTGDSQYLIAEADESDATFINIPATIAVVTNVDKEHLDFYGSFDELKNAFNTFINNIPFYGFAVCCIEDHILADIVKNITTRQVRTYAISNPLADVQALNIKLDGFSSTFDVKIATNRQKQQFIILEQMTLNIAGQHNILNALAAIAVAIEMDFGPKAIAQTLRSFNGVKRRFTKVGQYNEHIIIDDYAHHPKEIKATIKTAKNLATKENAKLMVICQPHRYSRVLALMQEFKDAFDLADITYIAPIYSAGEQNVSNIDNAYLVNKIDNNNVKILDSFDYLPKIINNLAEKHIILMLGAGSISQHAYGLFDQLKAVN